MALNCAYKAACLQGRLHTLLTSCFSHQGGGHLIANMCAALSSCWLAFSS